MVNMAASVRSRLTSLAHARGEETEYVLARYALERLLYRLGKSPYAGAFILKGALLFALWEGHPHRATRDLDLLSIGPPDVSRIEPPFRWDEARGPSCAASSTACTRISMGSRATTSPTS